MNSIYISWLRWDKSMSTNERKKLPSALVALIRLRATDLPKKEVRVSTVVPMTPPTMPMAPPMMPVALWAEVSSLMSNTFFCINTTVPFSFWPLLMSPVTPENIFATLLTTTLHLCFGKWEKSPWLVRNQSRSGEYL